MQARSNAGFSFIECLAVLSIILILTVIAMPYFTQLRHLTLDALQLRLIRAINYARTLAISRGTIIAFCGSANQKTCDGQWQYGQLIMDTSTQKPLAFYPALPQQYTLHWQSSFGRNHELLFNAQGFSLQQGRFQLGNVEIVVLRSGRLRVIRLEFTSRVA